MATLTLVKNFNISVSLDVDVDDKELANGKVDFNKLLDEHDDEMHPDYSDLPAEGESQVFDKNGKELFDRA